MENNETWVAFYEEFANKLIQFKNNRLELINIIKKVYEDINIKLPTLDTNNNIVDIDPFTVYGLFNKGINNQNRNLIMTAFKDYLNINEEVPTNFDGIPLLNNMSATFYRFTDGRQPEDINNLWNLFDSALSYSKDKDFFSEENFINCFDITKNQKGIKWNITLGLYWIRPNEFISLDSLNRNYLTNINNEFGDALVEYNLNKDIIPSGKDYLNIIKIVKNIIDQKSTEVTSFQDLSFKAWIDKDDVQKEEKVKISNAEFLKWFAPLIQALKDLGGSGTINEVIKQISENENLSEETLNETRGKNNVNKFKNNLQWARNYLAYAGIIDKTKRGIWTLTEEGYNVEMTMELASEIFKKNWWIENSNELNSKKRYWIYSAGSNASNWEEFYQNNIMGLGWDWLGDYTNYNSKTDIKNHIQENYDEENSYKNASLAVWQFVNEMKVGDIVYSKKGINLIVGRGIIESDYIYDENRKEYKSIRKVNWTHQGEFTAPKKSNLKTLTDITQYTDYIKSLESLFTNEETIIDEDIIYPKYTKEDFLNEVYISEPNYDTLTNLLKLKKNIILEGSPGVGKTFAAKRLAYSIMEEKDLSRVEMVQFHQSYAYEDFIMGYRPDENGFKLEHGAFYNFCKKAQDDNERDYFFIIDEINRGNLSKIFGELFMLLEHDKRDERNSIRLLYADEQFYIPSNVHIIGMMNTADRSLALLDYALRRRFAFFQMEPAFNSEGFIEYQKNINNNKFNKLIEVIKLLNNEINEDISLGSGFRIGHSYFITNDFSIINDNWIKNIVNYEIIPLLNEYWFDEKSKVEEWTNKLRVAIS